MVKGNQILRYPPTLTLVNLQDRAFGKTLDDSANLPAKVIGIFHASIHLFGE